MFVKQSMLRRVCFTGKSDMPRFFAPLLVFLAYCSTALAEPASAERGKKALTETAFIPSFWTNNAIENVWRQWGLLEKPANFWATFRDRYGLHDAPYRTMACRWGCERRSTSSAWA